MSIIKRKRGSGVQVYLRLTKKQFYLGVDGAIDPDRLYKALSYLWEKIATRNQRDLAYYDRVGQTLENLLPAEKRRRLQEVPQLAEEKAISSQDLDIVGFIKTSLVDWEGRLSFVIVLAGCNLHCPTCSPFAQIICEKPTKRVPVKKVELLLNERRRWIEGVVITGGEPTIHSGLPNLCRIIRNLGIPIKLNTNGTNPAVIKELIDNRLVNFVTMHIGAPLTEEEYSEACGIDATNILSNIRKTISILLESNIEYEFRRTIVSTLHRMRGLQRVCQPIIC